VLNNTPSILNIYRFLIFILILNICLIKKIKDIINKFIFKIYYIINYI
jgi:F0F1-type ATP synthase membrane subunit b/b'